MLVCLKRDYEIALDGHDLERVQLARNILEIEGKLSEYAGDQTVNNNVIENAVKDCSEGIKYLRKHYIGIKRYDGWYQECDCEYGYGPKHGSIVFSIRLRQDFRDREFSKEELSACIYYLENKIFLK